MMQILYEPRLWLGTILFALATLLWSASLAHSLCRPKRWPVFAIVSLSLTVLYLTIDDIGDRLARIYSQQDAAKSIATVLFGCAFGTGLGIGARLAKTTLSTKALPFLSTLPFAILAIASGNSLIALAALLLFLTASAVPTEALLGRPAKPGDTLLTLAAGLSTLSLTVLALGSLLSGTGTTLFTAGLFAPPLALLFFFRLRPLLRLDPFQAPSTPRKLDTAALAIHFSLIALFCLLFIAALGPETGPDATGFRLAGPVQWLREAKLTGIQEMLGSYGQCAAEMLHLQFLPLLGEQTIRILQGLLLACLCIFAPRLLLDRHHTSASLFLFLFAGSTLVWTQVAWGFVDLTQLFFFVASLAAIKRQLLDKDKPRLLLLAGAFAGMAAAIKLNGGIAAAMIGSILLLFGRNRHRGPIALLRATCLLSAGFLIVFTPWLIRSYVLTGNPVFPWANGIFKSPLAESSAPGAFFGIGKSPLALLRLPFELALHPERFVEIGGYNIAFLLALPLALASLFLRDRRLRLLGFASVFSYFAWALSEQNARYSLFVAFFTALAAAGTLQAVIDRSSLVARRITIWSATALTALGFAVSISTPHAWLWRNVEGPALPTGVVFHPETRDDYLAIRLGTEPLGKWLKEHHPKRARVWEIGVRDHLSFSVPATSSPHTVLPELLPLVEILRDPKFLNAPARIHKRLRSLGYTHLVINTNDPTLGKEPDSLRRGILAEPFIASYLSARAANLGYRLYEIRERPRTEAELTTILGRSLLKDPSLSAFGDPSHSWSKEGSASIASQGTRPSFVLPPESLITQAPSVQAKKLYALRIEIPKGDSGRRCTLQINWLDAERHLRLFWRKDLEIPESGGRYEFLQTAPTRSKLAFLYVKGGPVRITSIRFSAVGPH